MGHGSDKSWRLRGAGQQASARNWLRHWLEVVDGDVGFRIVVMSAGMLSSVAIAFGLLSS
ncbi:hypothetical protein AC628_01665 [Bradyrhizobium sp. NAS96.2]|nr:hypothetical protein AC628_01665 [Bradyrhizobium sp. NAS96.2]